MLKARKVRAWVCFLSAAILATVGVPAAHSPSQGRSVAAVPAEAYRPLHKGAVDLDIRDTTTCSSPAVRPSSCVEATSPGSGAGREFNIGTTHPGEDHLSGRVKGLRLECPHFRRGPIERFRLVTDGDHQRSKAALAGECLLNAILK